MFVKPGTRRVKWEGKDTTNRPKQKLQHQLTAAVMQPSVTPEQPKNKAEQAPKTKPIATLTNQGGSSLQGHIPAAVPAATSTKTDAKTIPKINRPAAEKIMTYIIHSRK
jgi:hypothetical protein